MINYRAHSSSEKAFIKLGLLEQQFTQQRQTWHIVRSGGYMAHMLYRTGCQFVYNESSHISTSRKKKALGFILENTFHTSK